MSMISEQVKELRYRADIYNTVGSVWELNRAEAKKLQTMLRQAADTIEYLSAKLQAANMACSAEDCGGWITDRVPTKEECNGREREFAVTVDANGIKTLVMDFVYETVRGKEVSRWKWRDRISPWEVIAWQKLPDPYHEP